MNGQVVIGADFHHTAVQILFCRIQFLADHIDALFKGKHRPLVQIDGDTDHQTVHQLGRTQENIAVTQGYGIKGPWIKADTLLGQTNLLRKTDKTSGDH